MSASSLGISVSTLVTNVFISDACSFNELVTDLETESALESVRIPGCGHYNKSHMPNLKKKNSLPEITDRLTASFGVLSTLSSVTMHDLVRGEISVTLVHLNTNHVCTWSNG